MTDEKAFAIRFNQIVVNEMSRHFELRELPLAPDLAARHSDEAKGAVITSRLLECSKTGGIRLGEMDFGGSMTVHFGCAPPGQQYNFPVFGFTFVNASKFLIGVLDLHPVSRDRDYMDAYIEPLKEISKKSERIPAAEGGRTEVHDWAKYFESGYSFYRWCDGQYLPDMEEIFRDYLRVFSDCIKKAKPVTDPKALEQRNSYLVRYCEDYTTKDPGSGPLQHHFGEEWSERYLKGFLFAP